MVCLLASRCKIFFCLGSFQRFGIEYTEDGIYFSALFLLLLPIDCPFDNLASRPTLSTDYGNCECLLDSFFTFNAFKIISFSFFAFADDQDGLLKFFPSRCTPYPVPYVLH